MTVTLPRRPVAGSPPLPVVLLLAMLVLTGGLDAQAARAMGADARELSPEDWQADLAFLAETIEAVHPRPFHRTSGADFDAARQALHERLPALGPRASAAGLMRIAALAHDGHTYLRPFGPPLPRDRWYPLRFERLAGGTFIVATDEAHRDLLGARVERFGGRPIDEVWEAATSASAGDNAASRLSNAALFLSMPDLLAGIGVGGGASLPLDVTVAGGPSRQVSIDPIRWQPDFDWIATLRGAPGGAGPRLPWDAAPEVALPYRRQDPYWFEREGTVLYAQMNQVQNAGGPVWLGDRSAEATLADFYDALMAEADRDPPEKLVIDLRWNGGGNNDLAKALPRALARRPEIDRADRLFVITGRATYSAAMNLVSMLEDQTDATFVGETPGGSPHHYGDATTFTLPRSGMTLRVSTLHWSLGVGPWDVRESMEPDIPVSPTIDALLAGRDGPLEAVRAYRPTDVLSIRLNTLWNEAGHEAALEAIRRLEDPPGPVAGSRVQQLISFGRSLYADASGDELIEVARTMTERYPDSHEAWYALGRLAGFMGRAGIIEPAYLRAHELRPQHDLIRRFWEAARRQSG